MITLWGIAHINTNTSSLPTGRMRGDDQTKGWMSEWGEQEHAAGVLSIQLQSMHSGRLFYSSSFAILFPINLHRSCCFWMHWNRYAFWLNDDDGPETEDGTQEPFDCKNRLANLQCMSRRIISNLSRSIILFWRNGKKKTQEAAAFYLLQSFLRSIRQKKAKNGNFWLFLLCVALHPPIDMQ